MRQAQSALHEIDKFVGQQVRAHRKCVGMTLQQTADKLRITYQQLQKYETGKDRMTVRRLIEIAEAVQTKPQDSPRPPDTQLRVFLTRDEVAERYRCTPTWVTRNYKRLGWRTIKYGKRILFDVGSLAESDARELGISTDK